MIALVAIEQTVRMIIQEDIGKIHIQTDILIARSRKVFALLICSVFEGNGSDYRK